MARKESPVHKAVNLNGRGPNSRGSREIFCKVIVKIYNFSHFDFSEELRISARFVLI